VHFQFLADNEHDKKIERNVAELRAALRIGLERIVGQLPCLKVEYEENKAIKALRDELKVQKEELTKFKSKGTFQEGVIKELEGTLAGFQRDAKDTGKDSAAKDAEIAELKEKLALLQNELSNTKAALDMDEYELKKDREMRVKDQQMLAEKDKVTEYLKERLKAAEEKDRESLANIMEAQMVYIYICIYI
jgi:chromosome segregation ATPase